MSISLKKRILVTAGPTREYLDPVRYVTNISSGLLGEAITNEADRRGYRVSLISGPVDIPVSHKVKISRVTSAREMLEAVKRQFKDTDILIMCAAVSDYRAVNIRKGKMKKNSERLVIELVKNPDILSWAGKHKKAGQIIVGFAMETNSHYSEGTRKLKEKNLDLIVVNPPSAAGVKKMDCMLIGKGGIVKKFCDITKKRLASQILDFVNGDGIIL